MSERIGTRSNLETERSMLAAFPARQSAKPAGFWAQSWRRFRRDRYALTALVVTVVIVMFSLGAGVVSDLTGFSATENHLPQRLLAPGEMDYLLGSDGNGRDVLTRLAYGGRTALMIAALATFSILIIGGTLGSIAGYFGGRTDTLIMRTVDMLLSIPTLALLILISSLYRPSPVALALFVALLSWSGISRLVRGEVLRLKHHDFVDAARLVGASDGRILLRHIFPNVLPIIIIWASLTLPILIQLEASLSYLGVGVRVPVPSWGNMLEDSKQYIRTNWTLVFIPGFMIFVTSLALNAVGAGIRDALDPR